MLVKLIIKSPNLRYGDITLDCNSEWTVKDLKCQIQNNYPTKPAADEQRLIYSGKLLQNTQVLGEVLRDLDEQENHIVHLVCTSSMSSVDSNIQPCQRDATHSADELASLRRRSVQERESTASSTGTGIQFQPWDRTAATNPDLITQQLLWWQQTYAQHYWTQYAQYANMNNWTQPAPHAPPAASSPPPVLNAPVAAPEEQGAGMVLGPAEEENAENGGIRAARDWLDWTYIGTRLAILMSFIYFYSSLSRFLIVVLMVAVICLYQLAVKHRFIGNEPFPLENNANNENQDQGNESEVLRAERRDPEPQNNSLLSLAVSVVTGFFTSLIPEFPAPEVAVN